ncbi:MAG TPA: hypothetical protein VMS74_15515, partial [Acidimicrobiia bacterium]|nr:hypothetical protein [Acidimicrobiia bacterium]
METDESSAMVWAAALNQCDLRPTGQVSTIDGGALKSRNRVGVLVTAVMLALPAPALAAVDPYGADELDLVAYADQVRAYSRGVDSWEVWVCDTANGGLS